MRLRRMFRCPAGPAQLAMLDWHKIGVRNTISRVCVVAGLPQRFVRLLGCSSTVVTLWSPMMTLVVIRLALAGLLPTARLPIRAAVLSAWLRV